MTDFDLKIPRDTATLMLAHPQRCGVCLEPSEISAWRHLLRPATWEALLQRLAAPAGFTGDILAELMDEPGHEALGGLVQALAHGEGSTEMGSAFSLMLYLRQTILPQPQFLIEDGLLELLEHTDIADDVPVSMLQLPFPRCYVELGRSRQCQAHVANPASGQHVLEGAYLEMADSPQKGRGLYVMLTGSPLGHENAMDDATSSLFVPMTDPEQPLRDALAQARAQSGALATRLGLRPAPSEYFEQEVEALKLLAKVLLYLNLPQARKQQKFTLSEALAAARVKKNPAKRARALRDARGLSDYILVSAADLPPRAGAAGHRGVKAHWRRGHYRMQRHGVQLSLQRLIFVQPTLVGDAAGAPSGQYKVVC